MDLPLEPSPLPDPLRERQLSHFVELERLRRATTRASDLDVRSSVAQPLPSHLSELERLRRVPSHPSDLEVRAVTVTDSNGHKTPTGEAGGAVLLVFVIKSPVVCSREISRP